MFDAGRWSGVLDQGIKRPHFAITLAEWSPDWLTWFPVKPISGTVTCDRTSQTRWSANLSLPKTTPRGFPDKLHNYGGRMRITRRIKLPRLPALDIPWGLYRVDLLKETKSALQVELFGLEMSIQDATFPKPKVVGSEQMNLAVEALVREAVPDARFVWDPGIDPALRVNQIVEEEDRWGLLEGNDQSIATAFGLEMYFDGRGFFRVRPTPTFWLSDPKKFDAVLTDEVLVSDETTSTREGAPNLISVTGQAPTPEPTDDQVSSGLDVEANQDPVGPAFAWDDKVSSPTYAGPDPVNHPELAGKYGVVTKSYSSALITTNLQALESAQATLMNELGIRKQLDLAGYLNPALEAGDLLMIHGERHILDSWTADISGAQMTATSRVLSGGLL